MLFIIAGCIYGYISKSECGPSPNETLLAGVDSPPLVCRFDDTGSGAIVFVCRRIILDFDLNSSCVEERID
jgi:hypothetical protein